MGFVISGRAVAFFVDGMGEDKAEKRKTKKNPLLILFCFPMFISILWWMLLLLWFALWVVSAQGVVQRRRNESKTMKTQNWFDVLGRQEMASLSSDLFLSPDEKKDFIVPTKPLINMDGVHTNSTSKKLVKYDNEQIQFYLNEARQNFILSRNSYHESHLKPLISIITRTFRRPHALRRNQIMVAAQLEHNFEHVILEDQKGAGMQIAEAALGAFVSEYRGDYICHVDDDDCFHNASFTHDMSNLIELYRPKVIFFCVHHLANQTKVYPLRWKQFPVEGGITTSNALIRKDIYNQLSNYGVLAQPHTGDYMFIHNVLIDCLSDVQKSVVWLRKSFISITAEGGGGVLVKPPCAVPGETYVRPIFQGGLGNQMFQVATAYAYAKKHHKILVADLSQTKVDKRGVYFKSMFHSILRNDVWSRAIPAHTYEEPFFKYTEIPPFQSHVDLLGYFQSSLYFHTVRYELFQHFVANQRLPEFKSAVYWQPSTSTIHRKNPTVAIHVRRTDYMNDNSIHSVLDWRYYMKAIDMIRSSIGPGPIQWFIFSDDLTRVQAECEEHWKLDKAQNLIHFASTQNTELDDFYLMLQCDHIIMANSSFSWWAAYLGSLNSSWKHPRLVLAPQQWFRPQNKQVSEWGSLYCPEWKLL